MNSAYLVLSARIHRELEDLEKLVVRAEHCVERARQSSDEAYLDAAALNMHSLYGGFERLFELIASDIDESPVTGEHWHQELLKRMATDIPEIRPAVLSKESLALLDEFRGFRHVVRNVYTFNFNPQRIELLVEQLRPTYESASSDLQAFASFLETVGKD